MRIFMRSIEWRYFQWPWVTPNYPKPPYFRHKPSLYENGLTDRAFGIEASLGLSFTVFEENSGNSKNKSTM